MSQIIISANNVHLTKASIDDGPAIHQLIANVLESYNLYHLRPIYVDEDIDDLNDNYFHNKGYFWVIKNDAGQILASVAIYKLDNTTCELRKMYLQMEEQGKGTGKILLKNAIAKAKELGYEKMILKTNSHLNKAIMLYQKFGFKHYPISEEDQKADCDVAMELNLQLPIITN